MSDAIAACLAGALSADLAIARCLLQGESAATLRARIAQARTDSAAWHALDRLCAEAGLLERLQHMIAAASVDHAGPRDPAAVAAMFDRAVAVSPEASVALYSLGDPDRLATATQEVIAWLRSARWLRPDMDVLDLGCGIGRLIAELASQARSVTGLDVSARMIAEATRRCAGWTNVRLLVGSGHDLAELANASQDLVLAVDSVPYLVQAGVADLHAAEIARVLRPNGVWVILNLAYGWPREAEIATATAWCERFHFVPRLLGDAPFRHWDASGFVLQKPDWMDFS
ncbi:MAG: methyltransferase domain-containing protein [Rhodospirillales bacterium]|nr:methyltransferase domain-containing protein [Rhodospirillales bacterium]